MSKKTYSRPRMEAIKIDSYEFLATSPNTPAVSSDQIDPSNPEQGGDPASAAAKTHKDVWDDWDE